MIKKRKNKRKMPPFVALPWDILNGSAYLALSPSAGKCLPYFLGKFKGHFGDPERYLSVFSFSYTEAERYGFAPGTFSRVITDLIRVGFIDPDQKGGLRGDRKSYNFFRLSRRWEKYGRADFERIDWQAFCPRPKLKTTPKMETKIQLRRMSFPFLKL